MPAVNPFIDLGANIEAIDGSPVAYAPSAYTIRTQAVQPGTLASASTTGAMNTATNSVNAAGTSENVALHVAFIVALALIGVYALRQSGFRFAVAGSIGR